MKLTDLKASIAVPSLYLGGLTVALSACTSVPLNHGGALSSYSELTQSRSVLANAEIRLDKSELLAAKTIAIIPTSAMVNNQDFEKEDLVLISNSIDRALCTGLSEHFEIVKSNQSADLTVHATITNVVKSSQSAAAASTAVSLGSIALLPVPIPRLPIGLGGLAVEAEALNGSGEQKAAMIWSRGANMVTTRARISEVGDAYSLSTSFGSDFSRMLTLAQDPFRRIPSVPSIEKVSTALGASTKQDACRDFGKAPGIPGMVARHFGMPPDWTDNGPSKEDKSDENPDLISKVPEPSSERTHHATETE